MTPSTTRALWAAVEIAQDDAAPADLLAGLIDANFPIGVGVAMMFVFAK